MLTLASNGEEKEAAQMMEIENCLLKPFTRQEFLSEIEGILKKANTPVQAKGVEFSNIRVGRL